MLRKFRQKKFDTRNLEKFLTEEKNCQENVDKRNYMQIFTGEIQKQKIDSWKCDTKN